MANRQQSGVSQHETIPGPGPNRESQGLALHPVEQMVDAAIDRIAREYADKQDERAGLAAPRRSHPGGMTPSGMTPSGMTPSGMTPSGMTPSGIDQGGITPHLARTADGSGMAIGGSSALALPGERRSEGKRGRLRWKGLDVSDEFRAYAERVARGEDLPPFSGNVLKEPHPTFPWDPAAKRKASRRQLELHAALWGSAVVVSGLLVWAVSVKLDAAKAPRLHIPEPQQTSLANRAAPGLGDPAGSLQFEASKESVEASSSKAWADEVASARSAATSGQRPAGDGMALPPGSTSGFEASARASEARDIEQRASSAASKSPPTSSSVIEPSSAAPKPPLTALTATAPKNELPDAPAKAAPSAPAPPAPPPPAAAAPVVAAPAGASSTGASASTARKEPKPEASGMGSLLVETPSF